MGGKVGKEGKGKGKGKGGEAPPSLSAPAAGLPALSGAPAAARPLLPPPPPPLPPWCGSRAGRAPLTGPGRGGAATAGSLRRLAWGGRGWGGGRETFPFRCCHLPAPCPVPLGPFSFRSVPPPWGESGDEAAGRRRWAVPSSISSQGLITATGVRGAQSAADTDGGGRAQRRPRSARRRWRA